MERMPDRQVMDFLVQFFATEICWLVRIYRKYPLGEVYLERHNFNSYIVTDILSLTGWIN